MDEILHEVLRTLSTDSFYETIPTDSISPSKLDVLLPVIIGALTKMAKDVTQRKVLPNRQ